MHVTLKDISTSQKLQGYLRPYTFNLVFPSYSAVFLFKFLSICSSHLSLPRGEDLKRLDLFLFSVPGHHL